MTERPILFSGEMVRAILEGRKSETRRIIKHQKSANSNHLIYRFKAPDGKPGFFTNPGSLLNPEECCPYGEIGDVLWVRETWHQASTFPPVYKADGKDLMGNRWKSLDGVKWKPSIHMPRRWARILLEITDIRIERIQGIDAEGAEKEGIFGMGTQADTIAAFFELWDKVNKGQSFLSVSNPWVWVISFKRLRQS